MKPRLLAVEGPLTGTTVDLAKSDVSLGRDGGNLVVLRDASVSRRHCAIRAEDGEFVIEDLGSRHGTLINGIPVRSHRLEPRDTITIGGSRFVFLIDELDSGVDPISVDLSNLDTVAGSTVELPVQNALFLRPDRALGAMPDPARAAGDLDALLRISTAISSIREPTELQLRLLELIAEIIPAERAGILLLPKGTESLAEDFDFDTVVAWVKPGGDRQVHVSRTVARQVVQEKVAVLRNGVLAGEEWQSSESLRSASIRSLLCVPLVLFERVTGLLYLDSRDQRNPFDKRHLELATAIASIAAFTLENARHLARLASENRRLQADVAVRHSMVGTGARMRDVYQLIARIAPTDSTVLVRGESGTGKELAAHAIHLNSPRAAKPFVALNCAAIPETLIESEIFGHEKGAFTGAVERKAGKLEVADEGTLFLDEIGELPLLLQAKLLRALQERTFERVGGTRPVHVDIRLVAATNRNLEEAVRESAFRQDLYYRLNVISITMPPLRDRRDDIPLLAEHFAARFGARLKRSTPRLSPEARECLLAYDWPGNVRELENAIERAVVLGQGDLIQLEDLPEALLEKEATTSAGGTTRYHDAVAEAKRLIVGRALEQAEGTITEAARILGLNSNYLHRLMKNLGMKGGKK